MLIFIAKWNLISVLPNDLPNCKEEQPKLVNSSVFVEYKSSLDQNEERLQTAFDENNFQTSTQVSDTILSQGDNFKS